MKKKKKRQIKIHEEKFQEISEQIAGDLHRVIYNYVKKHQLKYGNRTYLIAFESLSMTADLLIDFCLAKKLIKKDHAIELVRILHSRLIDTIIGDDEKALTKFINSSLDKLKNTMSKALEDLPTKH